VVYISSADLVALDARTGKLLWSFPIGNSFDISSSPSVSNGVVYVGSQNGAIYAVEVGGTTLLWSYTTGGPIYGNLAVGNGVVYLPSSDGNLYAFDAYSGIVLWKYPYLSSSPALANGVVYVGVHVSDSQCNLSALDASSGDLLWQYEISPPGSGDPSVADGMVYVGDFYSNVYAFGLTHGEPQGVLSARPDPGTLIPDLGLRNFP
jgi:eukaryotic-like serine/threonine-protein kinase